MITQVMRKERKNRLGSTEVSKNMGISGVFDAGDGDWILTLRALPFLATLLFGDANLMAATPAGKFNDSRPFRHKHDDSALRAFAFLARGPIVNAYEATATGTGKPYHVLLFLVTSWLRGLSGEPCDGSTVT
jgi:hypothetical protein